MSASAQEYCFDTNAFIKPWHEWYPPDIFPDFWEHLDELAKKGGAVYATDEVLVELERIEDDLYKWVKKRPYLIRTLNDDVQNYVSEILTDFDKLINAQNQKNFADPFVIAHARCYGSIVVTAERSDPKSRARAPKIPDVCAHYKIESISVLEFIRRTGLKFKADRL